jgi:hypothetical protein
VFDRLIPDPRGELFDNWGDDINEHPDHVPSALPDDELEKAIIESMKNASRRQIESEEEMLAHVLEMSR